MEVRKEHIQVLKTLYNSGQLSRHAMKSIRGQVLSMQTHEEREFYLRKLIMRSDRK